MKKPLYTLVAMLSIAGLCSTFETMSFKSETYSSEDPLGRGVVSQIADTMNAYSQKLIVNTNTQSVIIRTCDTNDQPSVEQIEHYVRGKNIDGVVIDAPFGSIHMFTDEGFNKYDKIHINGLTLSQIVSIENHNPLFGKKLTIIGDSQSCSPSKDTCYAGLIAERNKMKYVNNGVGGTKIVNQTTNPSTGVVYPAIVDSYEQDIPLDSDFILIQAGYNDSFDKNVDDESTDRSTFKGCWNIMLTGIRQRYPNAVCGVMLPYHWITSRVERVEWMKTRCDKYGFEYFDQTELFTTNQVQYFEAGAAFAVHLSEIGARKASYPIENWMKTTMNIYNNKLYK